MSIVFENALMSMVNQQVQRVRLLYILTTEKESKTELNLGLIGTGCFIGGWILF